MLFVSIYQKESEKTNLKKEWANFSAWMTRVFLFNILRFVSDTKAESKAGDWIGLIITMIIGIILIPIAVDQVQNTNTTGWTFTGSSGAKTLFLLLPFIFIVGMIVYFIGRLLGKI